MWVPEWLPDEAKWPMGSMSVAPGFYDLVANLVAQQLYDLFSSNLPSQFYQQGCLTTRAYGQFSIGSVRLVRNSERTKRCFTAIGTRNEAGTMAAALQVPVPSSHAASSTRPDKHQATSPVREKGQLEPSTTRHQLNRSNSQRVAENLKAGKRKSLRQKDVHSSVPAGTLSEETTMGRFSPSINLNVPRFWKTEPSSYDLGQEFFHSSPSDSCGESQNGGITCFHPQTRIQTGPTTFVEIQHLHQADTVLIINDTAPEGYQLAKIHCVFSFDCGIKGMDLSLARDNWFTPGHSVSIDGINWWLAGCFDSIHPQAPSNASFAKTRCS